MSPERFVKGRSERSQSFVVVQWIARHVLCRCLCRNYPLNPLQRERRALSASFHADVRVVRQHLCRNRFSRFTSGTHFAQYTEPVVTADPHRGQRDLTWGRRRGLSVILRALASLRRACVGLVGRGLEFLRRPCQKIRAAELVSVGSIERSRTLKCRGCSNETGVKAATSKFVA